MHNRSGVALEAGQLKKIADERGKGNQRKVTRRRRDGASDCGPSESSIVHTSSTQGTAVKRVLRVSQNRDILLWVVLRRWYHMA